jgi:hypothetical protein
MNDGTFVDDNDYVDDVSGDPGDQSPTSSLFGGTTPGSTPAAGATGTDDEPGYAGDPNDDAEPEPQAASGAGTDPIADIYDVLGFQDGMLTLDDQQVRFHELSSEQRREVLADALAEERQAGYTQAEQELGLSEQEIQILNHFREHQSLDGLVSTGPSELASASADELHRREIVGLYPNFTEQQVTEQLEARRSLSTYAQQAELIRGRLQQAATQEATQRQEQEYTTYATEIQQAVRSITTVAGVPVDPEHLQYVQQQLTERNPETGNLAPFIARLSNPRDLAEIAYKAEFFDSMVQGFQTLLREARSQGGAQALGHNAPRGGQQSYVGGAAPAGQGRPANGGLTNEDLDGL